MIDEIVSAAHQAASKLAADVRLKAELLAMGATVSDGTRAALDVQGKRPTRVRSGSCGGVDLVLRGGTYVNCPTEEIFAKASPFSIEFDGATFRVQDERSPGETTRVIPVPSPKFYTAGERGVAVGQLCFDRLGIGLTNRCLYWSRSSSSCQFCSIGLNTNTERRDKHVDDMIDVVRLAYEEPAPMARASHVLLGGGTWPSADAIARQVAVAAREIKTRWSNPVYAMIVPPDDLDVIDELADAGVDEIGLNIELYSDVHCERFLPKKHAEHKKAAYEAALRRSVDRIGPVNTRSILIVGLEPRDQTLDGVRWLCGMGVMPILSPFRPLVGTPLESLEREPGTRTGSELRRLAEDAQAIADEYGLPLGPTCIPCQGNTLNVPGHPLYRYYGEPPEVVV